MSDNPVAPINENEKGLTHESWIGTLGDIVNLYGKDTAVGDLANFAAEILKRCRSTPALATYLDERAKEAYGDV